MRRTTLAVYGFGYDLERIQYPWRASLQSAIALCGSGGAVFFAACDDATYEAAFDSFAPAIEAGVLIVSRDEWGDHHSVQAKIANRLLDRIGERFDFALKLDMDEVLCEWSFDVFGRELSLLRGHTNVALARPRYTHFCPDDRHTFPFIYDSKAVISRTSAGLRYNTDPARGNADACALGGSAEFQTSLEVFHYGKMDMGRRVAALHKELSFQQLYVDLGFPDPKVMFLSKTQGYMDYYKVFDVARASGEFRGYAGPHPIFAQAWLEEMRLNEQAWQEAQVSA